MTTTTKKSGPRVHYVGDPYSRQTACGRFAPFPDGQLEHDVRMIAHHQGRQYTTPVRDLVTCAKCLAAAR